jgi:predicted cupin superfamily sugar epimerase
MNTDKTNNADFWIERLGLAPHAKGDWYRELWRSGLEIPQDALPVEYGGPHSACTFIYYLLRGEEQSAWHGMRSAEIWLWHIEEIEGIEGIEGILELSLGGRDAAPKAGETRLLGPDDAKNAGFQAVVPPGVWQSARIYSGNFVLVSCIVFPGFHWQDFSLY